MQSISTEDEAARAWEGVCVLALGKTKGTQKLTKK
jgi:hypothetical protein